MIKNKIKKIYSNNLFLNNKYLLYKFTFIKKNLIINKIYFYKIIIFFQTIKKNIIFIKKIYYNINICGSGGDGINLPNITTTSLITLYSIIKFLFKNSGNSINMKNGSLDYLSKIKNYNFFFMKNKKNLFLNIKKFFNYNFFFRKKIKKNSYFNIINPILNIFFIKKNILGIYSIKKFLFYNFLNINFMLLFYNLSDDILQNFFINFKEKKKYFLNNLQINLHNLFFFNNIFSENLKFQIFNIKHKKNIFLFSKIIILFIYYNFKINNLIKFYYYIFLNNYFYKFLKNKIKSKYE